VATRRTHDARHRRYRHYRLPQGGAPALGRGGTDRRAAEACAEAGNPQKGVEVVLDVDQLIYEANTFLNSASLLSRISKARSQER
jgi:hypothetical protein